MDHIHVTVAAIIKRNNRFLLVKERASNGNIVFNQPAGHVELGESLVDAVVREVDEETGLCFVPKALVGTYLLSPASNGKTYLRFCFVGEIDGNIEPSPKDSDILDSMWLPLTDILEFNPQQLRSALVLQCIQDFNAGKRLPLETLHFSGDEPAMGIDCSTHLLKQLSSQ